MQESGRSKAFRDLASALMWSLFAFFGVLTYLFEIRQYVSSSLGTYFVGLLDGVVMMITVLAVSSYLISRERRPKS